MRCGDCVHWKYYGPLENEPPQGKCESPNFINLDNAENGFVANLEKSDQILAHCTTPHITGEDFGCVHYESPERPSTQNGVVLSREEYLLESVHVVTISMHGKNNLRYVRVGLIADSLEKLRAKLTQEEINAVIAGLEEAKKMMEGVL